MLFNRLKQRRATELGVENTLSEENGEAGRFVPRVTLEARGCRLVKRLKLLALLHWIKALNRNNLTSVQYCERQLRTSREPATGTLDREFDESMTRVSDRLTEFLFQISDFSKEKVVAQKLPNRLLSLTFVHPTRFNK